MSAQLREQLTELRKELMPEASEEQAPPEAAAVQEEEQSTLGEEDSQEEQAATEDDGEVKLFNELPEAMGWDAEQFYNLKLKTDSGTEYSWSQVKDTLQDLEKNKSIYENRFQELQARERQLQEAAASFGNYSQTMTAEVQQAQQELVGLQNYYNQVTQQITAFEKEDDTENLTKAQGEILKIQAAYGVAQQKMQQALASQQQQQQASQQQYIATQQNMVAEVLPDWREPEKRKLRQAEMRDYLTAFGLLPQEIGGISDARLIVLIDKAMQWDSHSKKVKEVSSDLKTKSVRRIVRGSHPSSSISTDAANKAIEKAKQSHRERDKRAAYMAVAKQAGLL